MTVESSTRESTDAHTARSRPPDVGATPRFTVARRGYEQAEVDAHLQSLNQHLAEARAAWQREARRAATAENELKSTRGQLHEQQQQRAGAAPDSAVAGYGQRMEKLLLAAEAEGAQIRTSASREAAGLLTAAQEKAEAHRHEVEQSLIERNAAAERDATQRQVALDEREHQLAQHTEHAHAQAEQLLTETQQRAEAILDDAHTRAARERLNADYLINERRQAAEGELARLHTLHEDVRGKLARLLAALSEELHPETAPAPCQPSPQPDHGYIPTPTPRDQRPDSP